MGECLALSYTNRLQNLKIFSILLSLDLGINFHQRLEVYFGQQFGDRLHNNIESIVANIAGGMTEHMRQKKPHNVIAAVLAHPNHYNAQQVLGRNDEYINDISETSLVGALIFQVLVVQEIFILAAQGN